MSHFLFKWKIEKTTKAKVSKKDQVSTIPDLQYNLLIFYLKYVFDPAALER